MLFINLDQLRRNSNSRRIDWFCITLSRWWMSICQEMGREIPRVKLYWYDVIFLTMVFGNCLSQLRFHYDDVIMSTIASQITSLTIVYSTSYSGADQSKHQNSASLAFVWGIHRGPVNSPHKWPVTRKMFPFDDVIMHKQWNTRRLHIDGLREKIDGRET